MTFHATISRSTILIGIITLPMVISCGDATDEKRNRRNSADATADLSHHNVLIIDDGFDLEHPVFKGKIASTQSFECLAEPGSGGESASTFEELKSALVTALQKKDERCHLVEGLTFARSPRFALIEKHRDRWNQSARDKNLDASFAEETINEIFSVLTAAGESYNYHGTATAGLIAYQNPKVRLHVIQVPLSKPAASSTDQTRCPSQEEIDLEARVLADPDVIQAFLASPMSSQTEEVHALIRDKGISMVNMSFGQLPRLALEQSLQQEGCGILNLGEYFSAQAALTNAMRAAGNLPELRDGPLYFRAAGNEGLRIDDLTESADCSMPDDNMILVGATDHFGFVAPFSNYGDCVELYAQGYGLVTAAPDSWLGIGAGTSLSSPLAVRHASLKYSAQLPPQDIRTSLMRELDGNGRFRQDPTPKELAYRNFNDAISAYRMQNRKKVEPHLLRSVYRQFATRSARFDGIRLRIAK